jgi:two-component system osmolarity sensor histidine kinase EnvZ
VAAEKFGKGQEAQDLQSGGPEEIRSLTASFLQMQTRVKRQIAQRTETISAVSHDLRTPLTRMKLQIAIIKSGINFSPEIKELEQDIDEMQNLINEYLDFSISDNKEKAYLVEIRKFIEEELIADSFKNNPKIRFNLSGLPPSKAIEVKKIAFRRAVNNVLENALKFANFVDFAAYLEGKNLVILIADDGPGIPEVEQDNVFRPFYRLDQARNLDKKFNLTTGSGLGMSIALDAVILHGGKIALAESKMGGLQVKITIPC